VGVEPFKAGRREHQPIPRTPLRFAELTGVRPMIETYPLEKAAEAYARMLSGKAQFRCVLRM
jgi:D-arabinose 1-dehydrogenase-like Zn-dependent alcohol dehydrogenase